MRGRSLAEGPRRVLIHTKSAGVMWLGKRTKLPYWLTRYQCQQESFFLEEVKTAGGHAESGLQWWRKISQLHWRFPPKPRAGGVLHLKSSFLYFQKNVPRSTKGNSPTDEGRLLEMIWGYAAVSIAPRWIPLNFKAEQCLLQNLWRHKMNAERFFCFVTPSRVLQTKHSNLDCL